MTLERLCSFQNWETSGPCFIDRWRHVACNSTTWLSRERWIVLRNCWLTQITNMLQQIFFDCLVRRQCEPIYLGTKRFYEEFISYTNKICSFNESRVIFKIKQKLIIIHTEIPTSFFYCASYFKMGRNGISSLN